MLKKELEVALQEAEDTIEGLREDMIHMKSVYRSEIDDLRSQIKTLDPITETLSNGSLIQWSYCPYSCGIVDVGYFDTDMDERGLEYILKFLMEGTFKNSYSSCTKNAGLVTMSDALGGEDFGGSPEYYEQGDNAPIWKMMQTPLARKLIKEGRISVSKAGMNPNSGNPIVTYTLITEHGMDEEAHSSWKDYAGVQVEDMY